MCGVLRHSYYTVGHPPYKEPRLVKIEIFLQLLPSCSPAPCYREGNYISVGQVEVEQGPNSVFYGENDKTDGISSSVAKVENLSTARGVLLAPPLYFLAMS